MDPKEILLLLVVAAVALPLILIAVFVYHATVKAQREKRAHARIAMFSWLETMGIDCEEVFHPADPKSLWEIVSRIFMYTSLTCVVRIRGHYIDLVKLEKCGEMSIYGPLSEHYVLYYVIEEDPRGIGRVLEVYADPVSEDGGTGFAWTEGEFAQRLNSDLFIKDSLRPEFRSGLVGVRVRPSNIRKAVEIQAHYGDLGVRVPLPSKQVFEGFDRIAMHIRGLVEEFKTVSRVS